MIQEKLEYTFKNPVLLDQALTHKSHSSHHQNERLEFLGDAVLGLALAQILMEQFPNQDEGRLTKKRANLVNETCLAEVAAALGLGEMLKLGKSEIQSEGAKKPRILAGALEALFGAVFLDSDFEVTKEIIKKVFQAKLSGAEESEDYGSDYKTKLQEVLQSRQIPVPKYLTTNEQGQGTLKVFTVDVEIGGKILGQGQGASKKQAEQEAAKMALQQLENL